MAHLALAHQLRHRAHRLLDRRVGVDTVLIIKIDGLDAEAAQAGLARRAHVFRPAIDAEEGAVRAAHIAELGRKHDTIPLALDGAADQLLIAPHAVHIRGVEKRDAEIESAVNGGDGFRLIPCPVKF
jgi:hypothetical protein